MAAIPVSFDRALTPGVGKASANAVGSAERAKLVDLAQQFEAMLLNQMLRGMRQSMLEEEKGGLGADTMTASFDQELATNLSRSGGFGLAQELLRALDKGTIEPDPTHAGAAVAVPAASGVGSDGSASSSGTVDSGAELSQGVTNIVEGLGPLSSAYGMRWDPMGMGVRFHAGVDIAAAYGREVPSAGAGRVVEAGEEGAYGTTVVIEHAGGVRTRYAHLSALGVATGQDVAAGQVVGRVGQTGRATGPHLHFEILEDGRPLNPEGVRPGQLGH
jgi:murein DD-endopeptidase MepM/ murein hydrolase activator NlpD